MKKTIVLLIILSSNLYSRDVEVKGSVGYDFLFLEENSSTLYESGDKWNDFVSNVNGDAFITYYTQDLFSITCDIEGAGTLKAVEGEGDTKIAPLELNISQLYINFMAGDFIFYLGKKKKKVGGNGWFNPSNRISPKYSNLGKSDNSSLGMVEAQWLTTKILQLGCVSYFNSSNNWKDISVAPYFFLTLWPVTIESYGYYENLERFYLGYNLDTYIKGIHLYIEGILKERADQPDLKGKRDYWTNSILGGLSYGFGSNSISLEYLFREEGWSSRDREYFPVDNSYTGNYSKNYLSLGLSRENLIHEDISGRVSIINSLPDSIEGFKEYYSCKLSSSISYSFKDLLFTGYFEKVLGGGESEYINLHHSDYLIGAFITFYY